MSHEAATSLRRRALLRQAHRHVPARASPFRLRCCTELVTRLGEGLVMAPLGSKPKICSRNEQRTFLEGRGSSLHDPKPTPRSSQKIHGWSSPAHASGTQQRVPTHPYGVTMLNQNSKLSRYDTISFSFA